LEMPLWLSLVFLDLETAMVDVGNAVAWGWQFRVEMAVEAAILRGALLGTGMGSAVWWPVTNRHLDLSRSKNFRSNHRIFSHNSWNSVMRPTQGFAKNFETTHHVRAAQQFQWICV
jgi:hypothetical protein